MEIETASGDRLPIVASGTVPTAFIALSQVYFSPHFATNLLSFGQLVENNCNVLHYYENVMISKKNLVILKKHNMIASPNHLQIVDHNLHRPLEYQLEDLYIIY